MPGSFKGAHHLDLRESHFIQYITYGDAESILASLKPVNRSGYYVSPCTPRTRQWIVDKIHRWLEDPRAPNILLLSGHPGAGKSTVASTLVSNIAEMGLVYSEFFCKRGNAALSNPATIWRTVAFDLAQKNPIIARKIIENLKGGRVNPSRADIDMHFKYLIEDPLMESWKSYQEAQSNQREMGAQHDGDERIGPKNTPTQLIVVLDALDECGLESSQSTQRRTFMNTVMKWSRLHPTFKLIVTSRDQGILPVFRKLCYHIPLKTGDLVTAEANHDIQSFFEQRFADIASSHPSLPPSWPEKPIIKRLTDRAAGLFIWAETVIRFLEQGFPKEQLDLVLEGTFREKGDAIDELYRQILHLSFDHSTNRVFDIFKRVVGAIVLARFPLHRTDLHRFLGKHEDESSIDFILGKLSSVISAGNPDKRIHISHLSFTEFICDPARCHKTFVIDRDIYSRIMALTCFRIMNADLRFNICQIETSHTRNDDLNLSTRIKEAIPNHLSYSCLFAADHLQYTTFDVEILKEVKDFMYIQLLHWLEALSLLKKVKVAPRVLWLIGEWSRTHDEDILAFTLDAGKFVAASSTIISQSTPHLYVSALPFAPIESRVSKQFFPQFSQTLSVHTGKATDWSAILNILAGHTKTVTSVAFSQDGRHIISGSDDKTICIWNAEIGTIVSGPFQWHTAFVTSVAFSYDGKKAVSASRDKTICVWDVDTGEIIVGPIRGHTDWVRSVAFSPDSKHIVSGSDDHTVRIWDVDTEDSLSEPFRGHTNYITSVAFSQNGHRVVSGSRDKTIRIWDVKTGATVSGPFQGHLHGVTSVAFSPDGTYVVSGSSDKTIRIWNAETGVIAFQLEGHCYPVRSVAFSQDGRRIVSGSSDKTVCIWDAQTGRVHAGPFRGHTDSVTSVAFAQDGRSVVSGSNDKTIHIWDAGVKPSISRPFQGHTDCISSVAFSRDGKRVVSGSYDRTIYIWDAETGEVVSGPFHGHNSWVKSVAFSPDGIQVVSGSDDETICVWDAGTGELVSGPSKGHNKGVVSVMFSQDGKRVVSGSYDRTICIWDVETGTKLFGPLVGHTDFIKSVAFSLDGKHIISGSRDKIVCTWDAEKGANVCRPFQGSAEHLTSVAFSQDGKLAVSGLNDNTICIWDAETGTIFSGPLKWHTDYITSVAFSPDGTRVVSGSYDKTVCVWDVNKGEIVSGPFQGHIDRVMSVAFSQDGTRVVSSSHDKTIRIWEVGTKKSTFPAPHEAPSITFQDSSTMQDGWILGPKSELLFWVPPVHRMALWRPSNICVIGEHSTKLDLTRFVHGTAWAQCRT